MAGKWEGESVPPKTWREERICSPTQNHPEAQVQMATKEYRPQVNVSASCNGTSGNGRRNYKAPHTSPLPCQSQANAAHIREKTHGNKWGRTGRQAWWQTKQAQLPGTSTHPPTIAIQPPASPSPRVRRK